MAVDLAMIEEAIGFMLKLNNKGWKPSLFTNGKTMKNSLCPICGGVCCAAVELGCDHNDNEIFSYCNDCLSSLIKTKHNGKCPLTNHTDPIIIPIRSLRRQILNH